ncbi:MAG: hypothetical protein ACRC1K_00925, partial [Planctomycetia bacterium]
MLNFSRFFAPSATVGPTKTKSAAYRLETLEGREVPATFTVTNLAADGAGSLPSAVTQANLSPGPDTIDFNIAGTGQKIINITQTLFVNDQTTIDATTQPGGDGSTPQIIVLGGSTVPSLFLFQTDPQRGTSSSGSVLKGFQLGNYSSNAITILDGSNGNTISGNWIGFFKDGNGTPVLARTAVAGVRGLGIQSDNNLLEDNTISGVDNGVTLGEAVEGTPTGRTFTGNTIRRNRIGTDPTGATAAGYGNSGAGGDGIFVGAGVKNSDFGPDNVLSGNSSAGVELFHVSNTGIRIFNNRIGTDASGTVAIGNGEVGVLVAARSSNNVVEGNLISGNTLGGIALGTANLPSINNIARNNIVGLDVTQSRALGNQRTGISVDPGGSGNTISGNVVGGHQQHGVLIGNADGNT